MPTPSRRMRDATTVAPPRMTRYIAVVLNQWPAEPDPVPREAGLWRGEAAIALTGIAMIVLLARASSRAAIEPCS
jgi:hypothetical protein